MDRRGSIGLIIVIILLILVIFAGYLVEVASRECTSNKDCSAAAYCGSDYECHEFPEKIIVKENNYVWAAAILGISVIIAAYLYQRKK